MPVFTPSELLERRPNSLKVRVRSITYEGDDINAYEVVPFDGEQLPKFDPGAHVDLYFRDGRVRQYSLCNDPRERNRYVFAVQRDLKGRGGSKAIFEKIHVGRTLVISEPRNNFPIVSDAKRYIFIAGGIGITPIVAMVKFLVRSGADFELHYCTRTSERTAFRDELASLGGPERVKFYHDGGHPEKGANLTEILREHEPATHLYLCGPAGFLKAARHAASHWPQENVHYESFSPPLGDLYSSAFNSDEASNDCAIPVGFEVKVASTGESWSVPPDKTILEVLRAHGHEVPSSCETGLCGTCKVRFLEGEPDHRDYILNDEEKRDNLLVCCSRSKSSVLVLDI
ncbi:iron-sulfur protein [Cupriavidus sp. TA19]|nr:iron-sulfur protein [Cupriavidus sp. TA19]